MRLNKNVTDERSFVEPFDEAGFRSIVDAKADGSLLATKAERTHRKGASENIMITSPKEGILRSAKKNPQNPNPRE